jgi:ABC-type bacteriocin/lantibiotic exporter with double-glycine peptidase domain
VHQLLDNTPTQSVTLSIKLILILTFILGALAQQLATDCMMIKGLTGERASTSASQVVTFIVSFAIAFYQCWEMTLVMVGLFPVIGAAFAIQHKFVSQAAGASMTATNEAGSVASQTLLNIRTINAFSLERQSLMTFEKFLVQPLQQFIMKGVMTGLGMGFSQFVILCGAGLAYYTGGQLVLLGRATFTQVRVRASVRVRVGVRVRVSKSFTITNPNPNFYSGHSCDLNDHARSYRLGSICC